MLIKVGSKGPEVKKIQEKLGLSADGSFGPGTESAVKKWQKENGLTDDGLVGSGTWAKMFPGEAVPQAPAPAGDGKVKPFSEIDLSKLKGHVPDSVIAQIPDTAAKFGITNNLRLAHLLSQAAHESGNFKAVNENLNYSAEGLRKIFPKYFPTDAIAKQYARNPEKIANKVYSNRMGNGDEASGDGWRYKGAGFLQTTGKSNYTEFDKIVEDDILSNPGLIATKYPLASAAFFFMKNNLWSICDRGSSKDVVTLVSKRVNGGTIGLEARLHEFEKFWNLLK
jgi:putative chitinase